MCGRSPLLLGAVVGFLFFFQLGRRELYSSHEARAAQNAQRMLDTGEWGLPVLFDGQADLQKPPGYYWPVAATGWLADGIVDAWAARLPAAVAGLATVLLVFAFLRRDGRPVAAWFAALALATATHFTAVARTARIDVPLTCAVAASLVAFYRGCDPGTRHRFGWHLLSAVAAAAGVLLKGPVALALIGPAAVVFLLVERTLRRSVANRQDGATEIERTLLRSVANRAGSPESDSSDRLATLRRSVPVTLPLKSVILGVLTLAALAGPWFLWVNAATNGEFVRVFFWHHNVERFAGTSPTLASYPWWYYAPRFATDFLPWTPPLVVVGLWAVRSGAWRRDRPFRFGVVWLVTMFAVLSASRFKRSDYLLPLYPGAAIAFGCAAEGWLASRSNPRTARWALWGFGVTVAAVVAGWQVMTFVVEPAEQAREEKRAFAELIRSHAPPPQPVLMFRAESHLLALRLGRPLATRVEWHDLRAWLDEPGPRFVVMPPEYVIPAAEIVTNRKLVPVARLEDLTPAAPPRPLVFLRTAD